MSLAEKGRRFIEEKISGFCGDRAGWITLRDEETSPDYGSLPLERPIEQYIENGIINLDKPPGPTSHEVVAWVKRMLGLKRAGHGGTLEPSGLPAWGGVTLR
jgi:hypothetical protein